MPTIRRHLGISLFFVGIIVFASAHTPTVTSTPTTAADNTPATTAIEVTTPAQPLIKAAYVVFDADTGTVLLAHEADTKAPIASITKLFTAEYALHSPLITTATTITDTDVATEGRAGKLVPYDVYTVRELVFPLLLESSNDAAAALYRTLGDTTIPDIATHIEALGLSHTTIADTSGLSAKNTSTPNDLMRYLLHLYTSEQHLLDISSLSQYVGSSTTWFNNNPTIDDSLIGGKHGYTIEANGTIATLFTEQIADIAVPVGYVVLGSDNIRTDIDTLRTYISTTAHTP